MATAVMREHLSFWRKEDRGVRDYAYYFWTAAVLVAVLMARWLPARYNTFGQIAWTIIGPGFTLSQVWRKLRSFRSIAAFCLLLAVHFLLMAALFPKLPKGHVGFILIAGLMELMTLGLAVQVWVNLENQ